MFLIASRHPATFARLHQLSLLTWLTAQAAGVGLKTNMTPKQDGNVDDGVSPNASLTVAPYGVLPHPANEAFAKCTAGVPTAPQSLFTSLGAA